MIVVNYKGEDKQFAVEVISSMVFMKMCEIQLPSIVVVSDQFFGKSNVLEYLAGISLPHDQGNCIRVPLAPKYGRSLSFPLNLVQSLLRLSEVDSSP